MNPEIQKAVEAGKINQTAAGPLALLTPGTYVTHKSWGFGQIEAVDFLLYQVTIHFGAKRSHPMQLQYAAESLVALPAEHILVQRAADLPGLKERARKEPVTVMRQILQSYEGRATQDQVAQALVPHVLTEKEFKPWLDSTKKALKKDGHFTIPTKKSEPFELRDGPVSHAEEYLAAFHTARLLKDQAAALDVVLKNLSEFNDPSTQLHPLVAAATDAAQKNQRLNAPQALNILLSRDEILDRNKDITPDPSALSVASLLQSATRLQLPEWLSQIPAAKLKRALGELQTAFADQWISKATDLALRGNTTRVVTESARLLVEKGAVEELRSALAKAISEHSIESDTLLWLAKERFGEFKEFANVHLLGTMISAAERELFKEHPDRKLYDLIVNDEELLNDLIVSATDEEMQDLMRRILISTLFKDLDKRSLLGKIIRQHPELQSMVSGESSETQESLIVSWASLEKRKNDYEELVTKKIPENIKEISVARSHGDLRENFEYKAAKEMQRVLMRRKADMERELGRARGTDFANPDATKAAIGTKVSLRDKSTGDQSTFAILGAWDGDPDKGIVSYQTAIAQALIGRAVGQEVALPTEDGAERHAEILSIEACQLPAQP